MNKKKTIAALICIAALTSVHGTLTSRNACTQTDTLKTNSYLRNTSFAMVQPLAAKSNDNYYDIPNLDTSFKTYMSYKAITDKESEQYKLQRDAWTDENGFRRIGNDYLVAMGTYYTDKCGVRFKITFEDENEITVTVGDIKNDLHTNSTNQYTAVYDSNGTFISANVLEFIVDMNSLDKKVRTLGSANCIEELHGNIVAIEKIKQGELT